MFTIIGDRGLIGSAFARKVEYTKYPTAETKHLIYMGGTTHIKFEKNPDYFKNRELSDFTFLLSYCKKHNIKFIYPSSALVYEKNTEFAQHKKYLEFIAQSQENTLGVRIFPVYGKGSGDVITKWCEDMKNDISPVIYGDGTQTRDFVYVDDVVDQILSMKDETGIKDVGSGRPLSFNEIYQTINKVLGKNLKPEYIDAPQGYSKGIQAKTPIIKPISLEEGIKKLI